MYFCRIPRFIENHFPEYEWRVNENSIALTFDDGPHPQSTPALLALLKKLNIPASHFLLGQQVSAHPELFKSIINAGHVVGNHSFSHPNGWKTNNIQYVEDILKAQEIIQSNLFRPPYGKIRNRQWKLIKDQLPSSRCILFNLMPGDFEVNIDSEKILKRLNKAQGGDIVVLHDKPECLEKYAPILEKWVHNMQSKGLQFVSL